MVSEGEPQKVPEGPTTGGPKNVQQSPKRQAHEGSRIRKVVPKKTRSKLSVKTFRPKHFGQNVRSKRFGQNVSVKTFGQTLLGPKPDTISINPQDKINRNCMCYHSEFPSNLSKQLTSRV